MSSALNQIERKIKRNTMVFIIYNTRKQCNFIIKILNLLINIKQIEIDEQTEEKLVIDFKRFNKILLSFSKNMCGSTLGIYSNQNISHELLKINIELNNRLYTLLNSIKKSKINLNELNYQYKKKYIELFKNSLNDSSEVFKKNIITIEKYYPEYDESLNEIVNIIKFIINLIK